MSAKEGFCMMSVNILSASVLIFATLSFTFYQTPPANPRDESDDTIKIGLLIPDEESRAAVRGAGLAVLNANREGGLNGRMFRLVVRSMEGPWGTGSKQAVDLIFNEKVWALLGSHDGRNAHLVEQAATKATVVFVSAWSGDPTLSQAFVPWFFNCVPNDLQQAETLVEEIYEWKKLAPAAVIYENDYDSKLAFTSLIRCVRQKDKSDPSHFQYDDYKNDLNKLVRHVSSISPGCIIIFCSPEASLKIFRQMLQSKMNLPVYGSIHLMNENVLSDAELKNYDNNLLIPSWNRSASKTLAFYREYRKIYGASPGLVSAYAFDGMDLIIEAVRIAGCNDREKIQKALAEMIFEGVTGTVRFDNMGNRTGKLIFTGVINGVPESAPDNLPAK